MKAVGNILAVWLAASLLAAAASADVVYLKNGNSHSGSVVSRDDKAVVIEVDGKKITVDARDVLFVRMDGPAGDGNKKDTPAQDKPKPDTRPKTDKTPKPDTRPKAEPNTGDPLEGLSNAPFSPEDATRPETNVFMLMRFLAAKAPGADTAEIRRQIDYWRSAAHDQRRRMGANWVLPKEFAYQRTAYAEAVKEVQELTKKATPTGPAYGRPRPVNPADLAGPMNKLRQAALKWPDPLLRGFLFGLAAYQGKDYNAAAEKFRDTIAAAPRVAAFRQARAMALLELKQYEAALTDMTEALRLMPTSRDAVLQLKETMDKTPGGLIRSDAFLAAEKLLKEYDEVNLGAGSPVGSRGKRLLMPGRPWFFSDAALLPMPPYDRLDFRQGLAVPVGKSTLLVDAAVTRDTEEVFLRLDARTTVPARVRKVSSSLSSDKGAPLELVEVEGVEFTPVAFDKAVRPGVGDIVTYYGANLFEEMGKDVRQVVTRVKSVAGDGAITLLDGPVAGEVAGPVLTRSGRLVTFLSGKTDPKLADGGSGAALPAADIERIISRSGRSSYSSTGGFGSVKRKPPDEPRVSGGRVFVLYATATEKLD